MLYFLLHTKNEHKLVFKLIHCTFKDQDSFTVSHQVATCAGDDDESAAFTMACSLILNDISHISDTMLKWCNFAT